MAKKKKTRKQKILAETKMINALSGKEAASPSDNSLTPSDLPRTSEYVFKMNQAGKLVNSQHQTKISSGHDYSHLKKDLVKTGILTTSIVIAQAVLFFILR